MMIDPTSSFPLLASDQADVMRIFLELMAERRSPTARISEVAIDKPLGPRNDSDRTE
jgi:hypothetical protein